MASLEDKIKRFLAIGSGSGYGDGYGYGSGDGSGSGSGSGSGDGDGSGSGSGYGYGSGSGYGYGSGDGSGDGSGSGLGSGDGDGDGSGYGYGSGDGSGSGYGSGYGYGSGSIRKVGDTPIYYIDNAPTAIYSVHGNYARGGLLKQDFTFEPCYIARVEDDFAHGKTLAEAVHDAQQKAVQNMSVEQRIDQFNKRYPDRTTKIPAKDLFDWHNILTGSCLMGRREWCKARGIDIETASYTVEEFIALTKDSYGGDIIRQLM